MMTAVLSPTESISVMNRFTNEDVVGPLLRNQAESIKQQNRENVKNIDDFFICHTTNYFPSNGIIKPRLTYSLFDANNQLFVENNKIIEKAFSILRPTVHFTINSTVLIHENFEDRGSIIIIDSLKNASDQLSGGYVEDVFCIGPYKISNNATILIPETGKKDYELQKKIAGLPNKKIQISYYSDTVDKAVQQWATSHNKEYGNPIQSDPEALNFFLTLGKDRYVSSQFLMKQINKVFCTHDITPLANLEKYVPEKGDESDNKKHIKAYISAVEKHRRQPMDKGN